MPDISELSEEEFSLERMLHLEQEQYEKHIGTLEGREDRSVYYEVFQYCPKTA